MPSLLSYLVDKIVKHGLNLNIAEQLSSYTGPITLIRRTKDGVVATRKNDLASNRGNFLLKEVLKSRYPDLSSHLGELDNVLSQPNKLAEVAKMLDESTVDTLIKSDLKNLSGHDKGALLLYLASTIIVDVNLTHSQPLPTGRFKIPANRSVSGIGNKL